MKEITPKAINGMFMLILNILLMLITIAGFTYSTILIAGRNGGTFSIVMMIVCAVYFLLIGPILFAGLKILKPNEVLVLTLFGKYYGTLKGEGFFFVNPFVMAFHPDSETPSAAAPSQEQAITASKGSITFQSFKKSSKIISLKAMTLHNEKQKINNTRNLLRQEVDGWIVKIRTKNNCC